MRFMIIVKATQDSEAGVMPPESLLMEMAKYHEELEKAGVLLDGTGLQPSSKGFKVKYTGKKRTIVDGPFTEAKELIAGYSVIQTKTVEKPRSGRGASRTRPSRGPIPRSRCGACSSSRTSPPAKRSITTKNCGTR